MTVNFFSPIFERRQVRPTPGVTLGAHALAVIALGPAHIACDPQRATQSSPSSTGAVASAPDVPKLGESAPAAPTRLLSLSSSAYHASIVADDDAAYLLTSRAVYRFAP